MLQLAVANSKHSPRLAPGGASAVGAVVGAAGRKASRRLEDENGERWLTPVAAAFPKWPPWRSRGIPESRFMRTKSPNKSPNKRQLSAAEKRLVITVNYFISSDLEPGLNQITRF